MRRFDTRGRGTGLRPAVRFEENHAEDDAGALEEIARVDADAGPRRPETRIEEDDTRTIVTENTSPDIGFRFSLNPYRGCEHGCAYCYARPYHEYLGYDAGLDFETRILAKPKAAELLERKFSSPSWQPSPLACSGVTDCYQPIERERRITRRCLEVCRDFRNPVGVITKNALVTRDIDLLAELADRDAALVVLSLTTLDSELAGILEPRASRPRARLEAMARLAGAGIPVGVSVAPIIPGLNDHEIPMLLEAASDHGASFASGTLIRLPHSVKDIFSEWLERHRPSRRELVLDRIREIRGGRLNGSEFHDRMNGTGPLAEQIMQFLRLAKRRHDLDRKHPRLSTTGFVRRLPGQPELF